ncbi:hypothetical protein GOB94_14905 [Granulicella sp. 5B5]|uniref:hypothetical protein n=1 Tax=Granulicella sp. 5B5 TaxID=1617967 RepID=UPI0015F456A1|nr:hypothetical protein [Granulicella sp. 5B5]QMV19830.1 hypothetical protein GOB94_14905 [Granulicella sp. 5B5]
MAYDLKLVPEPDHGVMPAIIISVLVLIVVAVVVFLVNPRKTAELKLQRVNLYAPHTEFANNSSVHVAGLPNSAEDDLYVVVTVSMTDKLRLPLYVSGTTLTLTSADGTSEEATGVAPQYYGRLESTFPKLGSYLGAPLYDGDEIDPGKTRTGNVLVLFPGMTEASWHNKKSAVLTISLRNQNPQTIKLP